MEQRQQDLYFQAIKLQICLELNHLLLINLKLPIQLLHCLHKTQKINLVFMFKIHSQLHYFQTQANSHHLYYLIRLAKRFNKIIVYSNRLNLMLLQQNHYLEQICSLMINNKNLYSVKMILQKNNNLYSKLVRISLF